MQDETLNRLTSAVDTLRASLDRVADALESTLNGSGGLPSMQPEAPKRGPGRPRKEPPAEEPKALDYPEVRERTLAVVSRKGSMLVLDLLKEYGAASAKDLDPKDWAEFLGKVESL